ncbi:MAG: 5'-nucleotidase C-terminal domain-containing protein [Clostridia bacterium]|nr:5'-nucleotidase C-terminal domain-containing protein [Clostridia bacterium]
MGNKFTIKLLALLLVLVLCTSVLFGCFDIPTIDGTGVSSSTTTFGIGGTTKPTTTTPTTRPTTTSTTSTTTTKPDDWDDYPSDHSDVDNNGLCDDCGIDVIETIDFYNFNDLHGKFEDTDSQPGVDELTTYLENRKGVDEHTVFLSTGDMWQGGTASNGTGGKIITDWMNYLGFDAMALGNHEFDWGQDAIRENVELAEFPILAINIYDNATGKRVDYCEPSVMIERGGAKIGIIGAIGDCYSSISSEMTKGINFKVGSALTSLVKAESDKLREAGADIIVYLIHDGTTYSSINVNDYYDISLSSGGYVDIVFGGHTHSYYITVDSYGVPHLQGGGDNSKGMTHVEVDVNFANGEVKINLKDYIDHYTCSNLKDAPVVQELIDKYWDEIGWMYESLGYNAYYRSSSTISNTVAKLYYEAGVAKWGDKYNIVLAGGSINTRSPYNLYAGDVMYGDLETILPFNNALYLCKIKGSNLKSRFLNNSEYAKYSTITASQVKDNEYYYIVADSWTALYKYAYCETVELYDETTFARDLLAQYIKDGGWSK